MRCAFFGEQAVTLAELLVGLFVVIGVAMALRPLRLRIQKNLTKIFLALGNRPRKHRSSKHEHILDAEYVDNEKK